MSKDDDKNAKANKILDKKEFTKGIEKANKVFGIGAGGKGDRGKLDKILGEEQPIPKKKNIFARAFDGLKERINKVVDTFKKPTAPKKPEFSTYEQEFGSSKPKFEPTHKDTVEQKVQHAREIKNPEAYAMANSEMNKPIDLQVQKMINKLESKQPHSATTTPNNTKRNSGMERN